ncbi:MAG: GrpB family protein [Actinomycetota bacterium]|nr:GrpB family protein [Actinomycetota bacterium]
MIDDTWFNSLHRTVARCRFMPAQDFLGQTLKMERQKPMIVAFRSDWDTEAADLLATLRADLGEMASRIEHIGSTAIPLMPSKDIIDLQVSVIDLELASRSFDQPLRSLGFQLSPYQADHVPAGRIDDPANWTKRLWVRHAGSLSGVNLHIRRRGSPNERLALLFRDWFLAHPEAVPAYGTFKSSLAEIARDTGVYADVKDPVVDLVIAVAEKWAAETNWRP